MRNKIIAIVVLLVIAATVIYINSKYKPTTNAKNSASTQPTDRPLPELTSPQKRIQSYTAAPGDLKYRQLPKPVMTTDLTTHWNLYTSKEYGFSFSFPPDSKISSTEALGYQLPPDQSYKGSRDNFEIKITNKSDAYFLIFLNYPNFSVPDTEVSSTSTQMVDGIAMSKQILGSTNPTFSSSEIIMYRFQKSGRDYIVYGAFDAQDFESINNFESLVNSISFAK